MQQRKIDLSNLKGKIGRTEMKNVMAGSGPECESTCRTSSDCPQNRVCRSGTCGTKTIMSCFLS